MKQLASTLLLFIIYSCSSSEKREFYHPLPYDGMKGDVMWAKSETFLMRVEGNDTILIGPNSQYYIQYDDIGRRDSIRFHTPSVPYTEEEKLRYEGHRLEPIIEDAKISPYKCKKDNKIKTLLVYYNFANLTDSILVSYNHQNKTVHYEKIEGGIVYPYETKYYDKQLVKEVFYLSNAQDSSIHIYIYDDKNNIIQSKKERAFPPFSPYCINYKYTKYDSLGNWIERLELGENQPCITKRGIKYRK